ncbi:MAG: SpoIIE family protein phosphatase [Candidatus Zixiibacteriota bacterium]
MTIEPNQDMLSQWPAPSRFNRSIRREFALYLGGLVLLLMIVTGLMVTNQLVATVTDNVIDKLLVQTRSYAGAAAKQVIAADGPDALMLTDICKRLMSENPDCGWAGIADRDGRYLAHSDMKQVVSASALSITPSGRYLSRLRTGEALHITNDSIVVAVPIAEQGVTLGTLAMGASTRQIAVARRSALVTVSLITIGMIVVGVPLTMIILRRRLKPLQLITESLRKVDVGHIRFDLAVTSANEFGYLAETLRVMGSRLDQAQKQMVETERMTRELEIAREIQSNILPKTYPTGDGFQFAGTYRSARTVGGDYYDFIETDQGKLGVVIADVSGKSLPGMLVMLLTRDLVIKHARRCTQPTELLSAVNRELLPEIRKGTFVTMFYGLLDGSNGRFDFASAGHNPLVHVQCVSNECRLIKTKGYPLGMMDAASFDKRIEGAQLTLAPGDWLVLYTDGINEAMNNSQSEYGMDRLLTVLTGSAVKAPVELTRDVMTDVESFVGGAPQADDMTLLALKWTGQRPMTYRSQQGETAGVAGH